MAELQVRLRWDYRSPDRPIYRVTLANFFDTTTDFQWYTTPDSHFTNWHRREVKEPVPGEHRDPLGMVVEHG